MFTLALKVTLGVTVTVFIGDSFDYLTLSVNTFIGIFKSFKNIDFDTKCEDILKLNLKSSIASAAQPPRKASYEPISLKSTR